MSRQFTDQQELHKEISIARKNKRVVFTNGCFDILHIGHVRYLQAAKALGDILLIAVNDDASIKRLKGSDRPVNPLVDRMEVLAALACVNYVGCFSDDTPLNFITLIQPDVLVKGGDWPVKDIVGREIVEANGGRVQTIPYVEGKSTTRTLEQIVQGCVDS